VYKKQNLIARKIVNALGMFVADEELNSRMSGRNLIILDRQFAAVRPSPRAQEKTKYVAERYDDQAENGAGE